MNCTNCGNPIGEGFKFCMKCGTPVGAPAAAPASAPAPGPAASSTAPVYAPVAPATGTPKQMEDPNYMPYCPPSLVGGNVIVPPGRPYRLRCPDCGCLSNATKTDSTPGYACTNCGKAYAYGGQLLPQLFAVKVLLPDNARIGDGSPVRLEACAVVHSLVRET